MTKNFFDSFACRIGVHCPTCRLSSDAGKQWRAAIVKRYDVGDAGVDFACPFGKPWNSEDRTPQALLEHPPEEREFLNEAVAAMREDRGLGDTAHRYLHAIGAGKAAELFTWLTGKDCGCESRQEWLNKWWPYKRN